MKETYTAIVEQSGPWWIGRIEEIPGVNCQEKSKEELLETLKVTLQETLLLEKLAGVSISYSHSREQQAYILTK